MASINARLAVLCGWTRHEGLWRDPKGELFQFCPNYSEDGNDMLELGREMQDRGWWLEVRWRRACVAIYTNHDGVVARAVADTIPKAVALSAYKALTGRDWVG